jgi:hypothetical protein
MNSAEPDARPIRPEEYLREYVECHLERLRRRGDVFFEGGHKQSVRLPWIDTAIQQIKDLGLDVTKQ